MPVPVGSFPHFVHSFPEISFGQCVPVEIFPGHEHAHHQVRGFHNVRSIIHPSERNGFSGGSVNEMRIDAMKAICLCQEISDPNEPSQGSVSSDPPAVNG